MQASAQSSAGGAAPVTLEPVLKLPLSTNADGSISAPAFDFTPGPALYIRQSVDHPGLWGWVCWNAPTLAGAGLLSAILAAVVLAVRARRRPQEFGHFYCTKCNYDLTAPGGMPPELRTTEPTRCPECGVELTKKRTRLGRSTFARLWRPLLGCAAAILGAIIVMGMTLEPYTPRMGTQVWLPLLAGTRYFPALQRHRDWGVSTEQVRGWSLPDGTRLDRFETAAGWGTSGISPDGAWYVCVRSEPLQSRGGSVLVRQLREAGSREVPLQLGPGTQLQFCCFSEDGNRAYAQATTPVVGTGAYKAALECIDLRTGSVHEVTGLSRPAATNAGPVWFVVSDRATATHWAMYIYKGTGAGTVKSEVLTDAEGDFNVEFTGSSYGPVMSSDGTAVQVPQYNSGTISISLADGSVSQASAPAASVSETPAGLTAKLVPSAPLQVCDKSGATVANLAGLQPGQMYLSQPVISRNGRWVAAAIMLAPRSFAGQTTSSRGEVWVWDLSTIDK